MSDKAKGRNRKEAKQKRRGKSNNPPHPFKVGQRVYEKGIWRERDGIRSRFAGIVIAIEEGGKRCYVKGDPLDGHEFYHSAPFSSFQDFDEIEYFNPKRQRWQKTPC